MTQQISQEQTMQLQQLEQNLQIVMMQKQQLQMHLTEVDNALQETEKTSGQPHKMVGGILVAVEKDVLIKDLHSKKELATTRLDKLEEQEKTIASRAEKLRTEILSSMKTEEKA